VIQAQVEIHEDLATKKKYKNPMFGEYFKSIDNPDFAVLKLSLMKSLLLAKDDGSGGLEKTKQPSFI
jgi:general stress protein 26